MQNPAKCLLVLVSLVCFLLPGTAALAKDPSLETADTEQEISYALGYDIFEKLGETIKLDPRYFFMGAMDSQENSPQMSDAKINEILVNYQRIARQKQIENMKKASAVNREAGATFLSENQKKEDVVTLSSGLQYKILKEGTGPVPKASDTVEVHYRGTLIDDTVFDSSYKRGKPAVFQVGGVIPGWVEALQKMKVGSKWMLYIPSDLAYGDRGAGQTIKPGDTLIFQVELLSIVE